MQTRLLRVVGALNARVYRWSNGRLLGRFPSGARVCLLTTTGRRSGQKRSAPLLYLQDGADYIVVASQGGAPVHPGWFLNLQAHPEAELQLGARRVKVIARPVDEPGREALWPRLLVLHPPFAQYEKRTTRRIPVVRLTPAPGA